MIGGIDIRLPSAIGPESMETAARAIRQLWPRAVFENGNTGEKYDDFGQIPFGVVEELFVYRDGAVAEIWEEKGAIPEVSNTMIHVIRDVGMITLVIDDRNAEMNAAIDAVRRALDSKIAGTASPESDKYLPQAVPGHVP
jgi:hypothetical protein